MRLAAIQSDFEFASSDLAVIRDAGFEVRGTFHSGEFTDPFVVVVAGEGLPAECESERVEVGRILEVSFSFSKETYGRQSLTKVHSVKLTGRRLVDLLAAFVT